MNTEKPVQHVLHTSRQRTWHWALMVTCCWVFCTQHVQASVSYREALKSQGASCTQECNVCHTTNQGGPGQVTQPFGVAMVNAGLRGGGSISSLETAWKALEAKKIDSDGDGVPDIEELKKCQNPNSADPGSGPPSVTYGCGARVARGKVDGYAALCAGLVVLLPLLRRHRSKTTG